MNCPVPVERAVRSGEFDIVPTRNLLANGTNAFAQPVMDKLVSLRAHGETCEQVLNDLLRQIRNEYGIPVVLGTMLKHEVGSAVVSQDFSNAEVRIVVSALFA